MPSTKNRIIKNMDSSITKMMDDIIHKEPWLCARKNDNTITIGQYNIYKDVDTGLYNIKKGSKDVYSDLKLVETAIIVVKGIYTNNRSTIAEFIGKDKDYAKHVNDIMFYDYSYKTSARKGDKNSLIFLDRLDISERRAKSIRERISSKIYSL